MILQNLIWADGAIQNGRRDLVKSRGSVNLPWSSDLATLDNAERTMLFGNEPKHEITAPANKNMTQ